MVKATVVTKYHIARLQTLLDDLGSVDSMYDRMYKSAENSANSAINENAVYMQSLQARINLARVEVEKLATAMGEALFTDGMIAGLQIFGTSLSGLSAFVSEFGALPITLGLGVTALTLFSTRFGSVLKGMEQGQGIIGKLVTRLKDYTSNVRDGVTSNIGLSNSLDNVTRVSTATATSVNAVSTATTRNTASADRNTVATNASATATTRLSGASRLLTASFGVLGVASLAVGWGIEKLLSLYGDAKKAKEELITKTEQENKVYSDNRDQIQELMKEYNELNSTQSAGVGAESQKRLLEIQNEIAKLMPSINTMEDEFGNSVFVSSEQVKTKISLLENQLRIQDKINEAKEAEAQAEAESTARSTVKSSESDIDTTLAKAYSQLGAYSNFFEDMNIEIQKGVEKSGNIFSGFQIKDIESFEKAIANVKDALNTKDLTTDQRQQIESLMSSMNTMYIELLESQGLVMSSIDTLRGTYVTSVGDIIDASDSMSSEGEEAFTELANSVLGLVNTEDDLKSVEDAIRLLFSSTNKGENSKLFESLTQQITSMRNSGITDISELEEKFGSSLAKIKMYILEAFVGAGFKKGSAEYKALETSLSNLINTGYEFAKSTDEVANANGRAVGDIKDTLMTLEGMAEAFEMSGDELEGYLGEMNKFNSVGEQLLGITEKQISETKELTSIYNSLSQMTDLTTEQQNALGDSIGKLSALYPHLVKNGKVRVDAIQEEMKANATLQEAFKNLSEQKLSSEEEMLYYSALGTKGRIKNLQAELLAMEKVAGKTYEKYAEILKKQQEGGKLSDSEGRFLMQASMSRGAFTGYADYSKAVADLDSQLTGLSSSLDKIEGVNVRVASSEKEKSKETKKSAKETSELTRITDKYALAQERLNTALAKVRNEQKNLSEYSKEYRKSLDAENELIQKQIALNNQKIADLKKVKGAQSSTTTTTTGGSTVIPAGSKGVITAPYNQKRSGYNHQGIDLDGAIGDRLDAFVAGKVIKAGKTSRSGNFVQVLDSQGVKHFYAHLDSIAVKIGDMVDVGTKIGEIGNTGNVVKGKGGDGSHLHYETKNSKGQYIDPTQFVNNAKRGVSTTGVSSTSTSTSKDERADALQQIEKLIQENMNLASSTQDNDFKKISSSLKEFQRDRDKQTESIQRQESLQARMLNYSQEYEDSVNRQYNSTKNIIKNYKEEDAFLAKKLKAGKLESNQVNELKDRRLELKSLIYESQNQETEYFEKVVASRMARFAKSMTESNNLITEEENKLESLNSSTNDYQKSQVKIAKAREDQYTTLKQELIYTEKMIATGKLSAQTYEEMTQKAFDLKNQILDTAQAIQKLNYEMIQTVKNSFDIKIDDVDFDLSYIQELRNGYDDTSGDYLKSYNLELDLLKDKMKLVKEQGEEMKKAMRDKNLGINELQDLEEQLEDNALAYASIGSAIKSAEKAIADFNKRIEENIEKLQKDLADNIIEQLKKAVNKAKDIAIDAVDDLIEKEEERHEKVMKQYDNELKAYQKLIDSKRREISDSDRDRTFNNTIGDLETERQGYQSRLNAISGINTFDAKKEREQLEKQIAEVNKKIAEENYQYEKTLREQQLDDLLDQKEEEIDIKKETETESHKLLVKSLNNQKKAWQKYYDDLLANEKLFANMREMILQGNFDGVEQMFMQHVGNLTFQLPELEAKFKSTWDSVAQGIRTTVLTSFDAMQSKIRETTSAIEKLKASMASVSGNWDIPDVNMTAENGNVGKFGSAGSGGLSNADLQVILAKFMNEQIAGKLDPKTEKSRIANIKEKSYSLAEKGRTGGSTISADSSLDSVLSGLSKDQIKQVGSYFSSNASSSGFSTKDYVSYIEAFGNTASQGALMTSGDLQVMTAKYIREKLMPTASDTKTKDALRSLTDTMANSGRNNLSLISSSTGFDAQFNKLTSQQKRELGDYMVSNSGTIPNASLKKMMESYGKKIASMDVGGMTKGFGSSGGVDGKGGRFGILHQNEVINNPLDTERLLKVSSVLDSVFSNLNNMSKSPSAPSLNRDNNTGVNGRPNIEVNIENMTGSKSDVDNMIRQIDRKLFREKGRGNG